MTFLGQILDVQHVELKYQMQWYVVVEALLLVLSTLCAIEIWAPFIASNSAVRPVPNLYDYYIRFSKIMQQEG